MKDDSLTMFLNKMKRTMLNEFEKVCVTERSFQQMMMESHKVFDEIDLYVKENYTKKP